MHSIKLYDLQDSINKLNRFFHLPTEADFSTLSTSEWAPRADIKEEKNHYLVSIDIPGVDPKDIKITMEDGMLSISGERQNEEVEKSENYYRCERTMGKFSRRFSLPDTIDGTNIKAKMNQGVLEVVIPKSEKTKPRTIAIEG